MLKCLGAVQRLILSGGTVVLPDAVKLVTLHPARAVRLDHRIGSLAVGKQADIAVIDASGPAPSVQLTVRSGVTCFRAQPVPARRPTDAYAPHTGVIARV